MLYFVNYLRGKWRLSLLSSFPLHITSDFFPPTFPTSSSSHAVSSLYFVAAKHTSLLLNLSISLSPAPGGDLNLSAAARARLQKEATSDAEWVALTPPPSLLSHPLTQQLGKHLRHIMNNPLKWWRDTGMFWIETLAGAPVLWCEHSVCFQCDSSGACWCLS